MENLFISYISILFFIANKSSFINVNKPQPIANYLEKFFIQNENFNNLLKIEQLFNNLFSINDVTISQLTNAIVPILHKHSLYSLLIVIAKKEHLTSSLTIENIKLVLDAIAVDNSSVNDNDLIYIYIFDNNISFIKYITKNYIEKLIVNKKILYLSIIINYIENMELLEIIINYLRNSILLLTLGKRIEEIIDIELNSIILKLNCLTNIINKVNFRTTPHIVTKIINSDIIQKLIMKFYESRSINNYYNESLAKFIISYDTIINKNYTNIRIIVSALMNATTKTQLAIALINNIENIILKQDVTIVAMSMSNFNKSVNEKYIELCNSGNNPSAINVVVELLKHNNEQSIKYRLDSFNNELCINVLSFNKNLKNMFFELNDSNFIKIMMYYNFAELINDETFINNITNRNNNIINYFIGMSETIENYEYCANLFGKNKYIEQFSATLIKLIKNNKNFDFLLKINDLNLLKQEKNAIKSLIKNDVDFANLDISKLTNILH